MRLRYAVAMSAAQQIREWRQRNPKRYATTRKAYMDRIRRLVIRLKNHPCADCGIRYASYVMDFDHVRGKKRYDIGHTALAVGLPAIRAEAKKCEVVCANCHRERTHRRKHGK